MQLVELTLKKFDFIKEFVDLFLFNQHDIINQFILIRLVSEFDFKQ